MLQLAGCHCSPKTAFAAHPLRTQQTIDICKCSILVFPAEHTADADMCCRSIKAFHDVCLGIDMLHIHNTAEQTCHADPCADNCSCQHSAPYYFLPAGDTICNKHRAVSFPEPMLHHRLRSWFEQDLQKSAGNHRVILHVTPTITKKLKQCRWLKDSIKKAWNVIVVAPQGMDQVTCPHCLFVHRYDPDLQQGRYALLYQLMQASQWNSLAEARHNFLYFPEEGIVHDVSAIST